MSQSKTPTWAKMVAASFQDLVKNENVFVADVDGDTLYQAYLAAFPEGTNPIYKKNTEHDCSCCRQFIRRAGAVITIQDHDLTCSYATVWDRAADEAPEPYRTVATLKSGVFTIEHCHPVGASSQGVWALKTETFIKVNAVTLSPNYWGENAVGNKHTFFVLDGAKNDELTRGFYNEFLHPRLEPHRKVFEVIADKTKCQPTEGQLSGLGFSSTKKESFILRAQQGRKQRVFNVTVGA
jgi:hypothetical protein